MKLSEKFRRNESFFADGNLVEPPASITYITVVSRDSVRIMLLVDALKDLETMDADVKNDFLSTDNIENHWIRDVPEFGSEQGKLFIAIRDMYGLKYASASFRSFMANKLDEIEFKSIPDDPYVWLIPAIKPDGEEHYEYVLMYLDNILAILMNPN